MSKINQWPCSWSDFRVFELMGSFVPSLIDPTDEIVYHANTWQRPEQQELLDQ